MVIEDITNSSEILFSKFLKNWVDFPELEERNFFNKQSPNMFE